MAHKRPDRKTRRELRRASRPPSTMTRKAEIWFWITAIVIALGVAITVLLALR